MIDLFSIEARRNPYPLYDQIRQISPVFHEPTSGRWLVLDYDLVNQVLTDHHTFSSRYGPPWMIFLDPPRHSRLRTLVARAFTPRSATKLAPRIRELARQLLAGPMARREIDLATQFAIPLPMIVIAELLGIPPEDRARLEEWVDVMLAMSRTIVGTAQETQNAFARFTETSAQMANYLAALLEHRRRHPTDDLLSGLQLAEVDGERLSEADILGFFQLLLLGGSETTTNLINNALLCFLENPDQLNLLREDMSLLPSAIEEVLRYRSPLQWMYRLTTRAVELRQQKIPRQTLVLAMIGAANRDPSRFPHPNRFDIRRQGEKHLAFGHGNHFCLGAPLARLEAHIALDELISRTTEIHRTTDVPWDPRDGLHVHGPKRLPIRFGLRAGE